MKKLIILIGLALHYSIGWSQEDIIQSTRKAVDSILHRIELEKDPDKRFELILSTYDTKVEGYPVLILETFQKLLSIAKKTNDIIAESNAYSFAGQGYRLSASYIKALEYHHKAIALAEQSGNISALAWAQNQIGHIYKDREENDKAIGFYTASKENALRGKVKILEGWAMMNLAAVYLVANQPDSSLYYGKLGYDKIVVQKGFATQAAYIYSNIAGAYSKMGDNAHALEYYHKAINMAHEVGSARYKGIAYIAYAEHFLRNKQRDSCIFYAKKAISAVQEGVFAYMAIKPSKMLMDIYENSNADSTIKYLKIFRAANDSLNSTRTNQQLQMMTFDEEQRTRDLAAEKIAYQNKIKTNWMLAALAVFSLIAVILFRNNRQKQRANRVLETTLAELKATQAQLIQAEKMASLGELTAGIAHEIQNPLNFVNNFSEVSAELISEMNTELENGDVSEAKTIALAVQQNLEKITHHGKRADAIVKGMLQHSQSAKGHKEPTNINALCDEYLRLSYHGLRAKDKSFNASLKTDFDPSVGNINVVPQDMGRVLLNILNNAFYAVAEKGRQQVVKNGTATDAAFQPTVSIKTLKQGDDITITITDNGTGIPDAVKEKIFQPFFTTKPTGLGTGLGLSLAYDIIKAHGGELTVHSELDKGTTFSIYLKQQS